MRRAALTGLAGLGIMAGCFAPLSWSVEPPAAVPTPTPTSVSVRPDPLLLAAESLDRGDDQAAIRHFREHLNQSPDAVMIRSHLAELLIRRGEWSAARKEYECFAAAAPTVSGIALRHRVQAHTRLMEIAQEQNDRYAEYLHRGIGLILIVRGWEADPERRDPILTEQTLSKAIAALRTAKDDRTDDARVEIYLAEAYERLGQTSAAEAARRRARNLSPDFTLSPWEAAQLHPTP